MNIWINSIKTKTRNTYNYCIYKILLIYISYNIIKTFMHGCMLRIVFFYAWLHVEINLLVKINYLIIYRI